MEITSDTATGADATGSFSFTPLPTSMPSLSASEAQESLQKWNLAPFMKTAAFRFDQPFTPEQSDAFLLDLFSAPAVQEAAPVCVAPGQWGVLGNVASTSSVKYSKLKTTILRLDFFDRLKEAGIVRLGDIAKCLDVQAGDILVSDRLRKLLLCEDEEEWDVFSAEERKELIFHVLKILAVGGGMNQYDDSIEPYLKLTKSVYKDLVTVNKSSGGASQVASHTYDVSEVAGGSASLFPRPGPHNFCLVSVDPVARHAKVWYAAWFPMM